MYERDGEKVRNKRLRVVMCLVLLNLFSFPCGHCIFVKLLCHLVNYPFKNFARNFARKHC